MDSTRTKQKNCNRRRRCLGGCGFCCLLGAIISAFFWSSIFLYILSSFFALSPNSITFNMWKETPLPMYMNVVLFNWTNPGDSLNGPEKPAFTEMGPYVFSEHHSKQKIEWNNNDTITFLNRNEWHFMENMSSGSLNDMVTNLNAVTLILGSRCHDLNITDITEVDSILMANASLLITKTVKELIFDGYEDPLLQNVDLQKLLPDFPQYNRFGWYYQRNMSATYDGVITMYTGISDIEKLGLLTRWNYQTRTGCYPDECGEVKDTIGNVLPLSSYKQPTMTLFNTDICGSYTLDLEELVELNNLPGVQYQASASMFSNSETCFCPQNTCPLPGVRDISACKKAPLFISLPHFLHADQSYVDSVTGLHPDKNKHAFFMSLANLTSVPMVVRVRLQTNILLEPIKNMTFFQNISKTYFPMYWVDQYAILTPELAALMQPLYTLSDWGRALIVLFGGGVGLVFLLLGLLLRCED